MASVWTEEEAEQEAKKRFKIVYTWTDGPNAYYRPHSHAGLTTHIILRGELTIRYPDADLPEKQTFGPGSIVNVEAKQRHEVWVGDQGCTYTIGEDQIVPTPK